MPGLDHALIDLLMTLNMNKTFLDARMSGQQSLAQKKKESVLHHKRQAADRELCLAPSSDSLPEQSLACAPSSVDILGEDHTVNNERHEAAAFAMLGNIDYHRLPMRLRPSTTASKSTRKAQGDPASKHVLRLNPIPANNQVCYYYLKVYLSERHSPIGGLHSTSIIMPEARPAFLQDRDLLFATGAG